MKMKHKRNGYQESGKSRASEPSSEPVKAGPPASTAKKQKKTK